MKRHAEILKKIVTSEGKVIEENSTACRDENGNWKIIQKKF